MTIEEAIAKWRLLTPEQVEEEKTNSPEFKKSLEDAIERAMKSKDPRDRFWIVDATGTHPQRFCVDVPPKHPNPKCWREYADGWKPIKGAAFPS